MTKETDKTAVRARADSIRAAIASLSKRASKNAGGVSPGLDPAEPDGEPAEKESPREFIHRRMHELDD